MKTRVKKLLEFLEETIDDITHAASSMEPHDWFVFITMLIVEMTFLATIGLGVFMLVVTY